MKKEILLICMVFISIISLIAQVPPAIYHTYDQTKALLDSLAAVYPTYARVDSIGVTGHDNLPIWAIKLSSNVTVDRDVPRVLFIGAIHSEELIGQELILSNIKEILQKRFLQPYNIWLNFLEIWFVPCMNPEGLSVVMSGVDATYRKNKRDNNNNGLLDFVQGQGGDIDGVDLNRNFPSYWEHGDSLYAPNAYEVYDYYRGPSTGSENETQAIINLMTKYKFVYSIVWHSSRTGNLSEKVYPPYNFKDVRPAPDLDINQSIGQGVALSIVKENGVGHYESVPSLGRYGASNIWAYKDLGNIQMTIECGTSNIQPDSVILYNTISRCTEGVNWLLNRTLTSGPGTMDRSMLTGHITDALTQEPLVAEISIANRDSKEIKARYSDEEFGRYWRPLLPNSYVVTFKKKGYETYTTNITVNSASWTTLNVQLTPKQAFPLRGYVLSNNQPMVGSKIVIPQADPDTIITDNNGYFETTAFDLVNTIQVINLDGTSFEKEITLLEANPTMLHLSVNQSSVIYENTFNSPSDLVEGFTVDGPWSIVNKGNKVYLTDSAAGYGFYAPGCNVKITTNSPINLTADPDFDIYLTLDHKFFTEWYHDYIFVEVSTDNNTWTALYSEAGEYDFWHTQTISLNEYRGQSIYLRLRLKDGLENDTYLLELTDPGWDINQIMIHKQQMSVVSNKDETIDKPVAVLKGNYPNPFNPETKIAFDLKNIKVKQASVTIYNTKGQRVKRLPLNEKDIKNGYIVWKDTKVSSGVYLYSLDVNGSNFGVKKAILLK